MNRKNLKAFALSAIRSSGLMSAVRHLFAGRGSILMFHEIHEPGDGELRTGVPVTFFAELLPWLQNNGWRIVSMDECARLLEEQDSGSRFVVITFDDGYRDNVTKALPLLERYNAPFTVYIPTGAIDRTLPSWWLGLRELFRGNAALDFSPMDTRFHCTSADEKGAALEDVCSWIHADYRRLSSLDSVFEAHGISLPALNDAYFLDQNGLIQLAAHPLATIGGHTVSHPPLTLLEDSEALGEMADNRRYLTDLLQREIRHFAYPYGNCGSREFSIAERAGFTTAVTTRDSSVIDVDDATYALPRLGLGHGDTIPTFDGRISGLGRAYNAVLPRRA